jgi:glutathione synthase
LIILDELSRLDLAGDTTYALMLEAGHARDHELWTCQVGDLGLEHDDAIAIARPTRVKPAATAAEAFEVGEPAPVPLELFDAVLMRTDPPVDETYLQATWILERARGKTLLVNDPRALREFNEHLSVLHFPDLTPPTIVTRSQARVRAFLEEQGGAIIVKPVEGFGGRGIFLVRTGDPNTSSLLETATRDGTAWTMAQRYLPEAVAGDKRIVVVDGEAIGAVLRVPGQAEARGNLHVGGSPERTLLDADDQAIVRAVGPFLREHGLLFVGLDVIGGRLTEINITSPTGIRHIEALEQRNVAAPVIDCIERKAEALSGSRG